MYKIKEIPEDFIVNEISNVKLQKKGKYLICELKKKNLSTLRALEIISSKFKIKLSDIGFAGTKDKTAITSQFVSFKGIRRNKISNFTHSNIDILVVGFSNNQIALGDLKGNEFTIVIKNLSEGDLANFENNINKSIPNYFGPQRFSKFNKDIGKAIVESDYKNTVNLILKSESDYNKVIKQYLQLNPNNFVEAAKKVPFTLLRLYVNAYQSYLWNQTLREYIKESKKNINLPVIGFGTEISNKSVKSIINKIIMQEKITFRSFINREIPPLSLEGNTRIAFIKIKSLKIIEKNKSSIKISFTLPKGSYATVALDFLFTSI